MHERSDTRVRCAAGLESASPGADDDAGPVGGSRLSPLSWVRPVFHVSGPYISRKTGYKIFARCKDQGAEALCDRSRRPVRYANQLPAQIESLIVRLKQEKPHWGARKIRELLVRRLDGDIRIPATSTIHAVLHRHGLVKAIGRPRSRATGWGQPQ